MKKTLVAVAVLGAFAGAAQAQNVTVYGLLDANVNSIKSNVLAAGAYTSLSQTRVDSGGLNGSRIGFKGSEDLGGGMSTVFDLLGGINLDAGSSAQGSLLFGRRAVVGLASTSAGTVLLGRNSSPFDDVANDGGAPLLSGSAFTAGITNTGQGLGATASTAQVLTALLARGSNTGAGAATSIQSTFLGFNTRFNNSVKYTTPNISGFSASAMYALGEDKTTTVDSTSSTSLNAKYVAGPLLVSVGYQSEASAATATAKPALVNTIVSVAYDLGVARIGGSYNQAKYQDVTIAANAAVPALGGVSPTQNEYLVKIGRAHV